MNRAERSHDRHLQGIGAIRQKGLDAASRLVVLPAIGKLMALPVEHVYVHIQRSGHVACVRQEECGTYQVEWLFSQQDVGLRLLACRDVDPGSPR